MTLPLYANRYRLGDTLGEGGMGTVFYALDCLTGNPVALKQVTLRPPPGYTTTLHFRSEMELALAREFQILASLRHPNIISVLDYGFDANHRPFFTMELLDNPKTLRQAAPTLTTNDKARLLIQLLQALTYLHRRYVLHCDLKPENVMVVDDQIKLLDFGLSMLRPQLVDVDAVPKDHVLGTVAYLAPELFERMQPTSASDLFAVGIIMYELYAGRYPYDTTNIEKLILDIIFQEPNYAYFESPLIPAAFEDGLSTEVFASHVIEGHQAVHANPDEFATEDLDNRPITLLFSLPDLHQQHSTYRDPSTDLPATPLGLTDVVKRLLAKRPENRYQSAEAVISDFCLVTGMALPPETISLRESYLQTAPFVGRHAEMESLLAALHEAKNERGSMILVGGESGVGKSRLLAELRIQALVEGAIVLQGQSVQDGGGLFQTWRNPLQQLVLANSIDDDELAILKEILPNLDTLLERPIADSPANKPIKRLIEAILTLFRKQHQTLVLLLEDLHWSMDSLLPLRALLPALNTLPILVVGSFRDDENPALPGELPNVPVLTLPRLTHAEITHLANAIFGVDMHHHPLVDFLMTQTEGNVFFMTETLRALAEEAGGLRAILQREVPRALRVRGIEQIIQQRLGRVPPMCHPALNYAAVAGRQLDLEMLRLFFATVPLPDLETWLYLCQSASVLEVDTNEWRFTHDKIREQLLVDLSDSERQTLHRRVAETLERLYPNDYPRLAHFWRGAGATDKEINYLPQVVQQLIRTSAYLQARPLIERGLTLQPPAEIEMRLQRQLGRVCEALSDYEQAKTSYAVALKLAERLEAAEVAIDCLTGLGALHLDQNEYAAAQAYFERSRVRCRAINDQVGLAINLNFLGQVADAEGKLEESRKFFDESLGVARDINHLASISANLNSLAVWADKSALYALALSYYRQSFEVDQQRGFREGMLVSCINQVNTNLRLNQADPAREALLNGVKLAREIGAPKRTIALMLSAIRFAHHEGQSLLATSWVRALLAHPQILPRHREELTRLDETLSAGLTPNQRRTLEGYQAELGILLMEVEQTVSAE